MALTLTRVSQSVDGNSRKKIRTVAFDSSYPTGGESMTAADLGLKVLHSVLIEPMSGYSFQYDHTNKKIKVYSQRVDVTDDDDAATTGVAVYLDEDAATEDGKLMFVSPTDTDATVDLGPVEVANTTDLSALTAVRVIATGI